MKNIWRVVCWVVVGLALAFGGAHAVLAQEVTATITGTVSDPSGAAVAGATATAKSVERGVAFTAVTNDSGIYRIAQLPVGSYELKVEKAGFTSVAFPALVLTLNQVARIDVALTVGQVTQTIEVTSAAPVLKTESMQVDTIINSATNDNLPLASRNYVQLTLLAPGSVTTDPSSFNSGNNTGGYGSRPLINGNREQANNFLLDGMDNNQVSDNLLGYTPAPDAIEEFNLITNNAPAEFGSFMGGIVNATIKSGTNSFHGDVWEFFRNDKLNANSWQNGFTKGGPYVPGVTNRDGTLLRGKLRWNMFGGTVGGPVIKNKLFFFADYQGQRFDNPASTANTTVYSALERTGDFGQLCPAGFDAVGGCLNRQPGPTSPPNTTCVPGQNTLGCVVADQLYNPCVSFTAVCTASSPSANPRQPFAFNKIPKLMLSPVAQALFASPLYLPPTNTNPQNNVTYITNSMTNVDQGDLKVDYKASSKDNISGRFTRAYQNNPGANSFALLGNGFSTTPIYNIVGDWSRTIGASLVNDARFGWSHITLNQGTGWASGVGQFGNTIGIGNGNPTGIDGMLNIVFGNSALSNFGTTEQTTSFDDKVWQAEDAVGWTHGRHSIKFGAQLNHQIVKTFYAGNNGQLGIMEFDGRFTSSTIGSSGGGTGDGGADFALGLPWHIGRGVSTGKTWTQTNNVIGVYAEDTWKFTDRLTLNLGLRYQAFTPWVEIHNQQSNYNIATGNVDLAGQNGASRALYNGFYGGRDFEPRIGFAWTPAMLGNHTVIRGAFTVSSYLEGTGTNLRLAQNPPFTPAQLDKRYNGAAFPLPGSTTTDGIPPTPPNGSCANYSCFAGAILNLWDPNVQPALDYQWNVAVQHQFWRDTTVQVGYVGQRATHLMVPFSYTQGVLNPSGPPSDSPFFAKNTTFLHTISTVAGGTQSNGNMNYNSLQAVLQKQMGHGLQYQVSYTYSKCYSDSTGYYGAWSNALSASAYWQNIYDPKSEWAPCYYDASHVLSAYAVYELPFGRGKALGNNMNKVVNAVVAGWTVSPIISFRTGFPMPVYGASDTTNTNSRGSRADCKSLPKITGATPISTAGVGGYQWFTNNGNFIDPGTEIGVAPHFGSCAPQLDGLRGPRYTDVDLSVHKDFSFTERFKLQFRTDFINAFNHVQLNAPNMGLGPTMGQISSGQGAQPPRNIQLALKLYY
jgi:hypothetical protein